MYFDDRVNLNCEVYDKFETTDEFFQLEHSSICPYFFQFFLKADLNEYILLTQVVMTLFDQMNESDQEEYFKLHNKYESDIVESNFRLKLKFQMLKTLTMMMEADHAKAEIILQEFFQMQFF